jgi:hypothetical protein
MFLTGMKSQHSLHAGKLIYTSGSPGVLPRDPRSTPGEPRIPSEIAPDPKGSATISEGIRGYISVTATLNFTVVIEVIFY